MEIHGIMHIMITFKICDFRYKPVILFHLKKSSSILYVCMNVSNLLCSLLCPSVCIEFIDCIKSWWSKVKHTSRYLMNTCIVWKTNMHFMKMSLGDFCYTCLVLMYCNQLACSWIELYNEWHFHRKVSLFLAKSFYLSIFQKKWRLVD